MNKFIKRHYAFLYYKHNILKKGLNPVDKKLAIGMYLYVYILCIFPILFILGKLFIYNIMSILSAFSLTHIKISGGILMVLVFIYVHKVTQKVDYKDYQFEYRRDNLIYSTYEVMPFILLFSLVMLAKQI